MTAAEFAALYPLFMREHGPALVVVIPLLGAVLASFSPDRRAAWWVALAATALTAAIAALLMAQAWAHGFVSYAVGGWAPPHGIEFRIDRLSGAIILLVGVLAFLCAVYAPSSVRAEIDPRKHSMFFAAFLVCVTGLLGVAVTGDAFTLFVFLEISSISTYVLVAMGDRRDRRALTAAYNYLVLGTIGATFYVIGVGFLYAATGTLNLADLAARLAPLADSATVRTGFAFIIIGLGLKLAMFPLHSWLPNAYTFAPSFVTAFLASTATKVAFYALVRFLYTVFGPTYSFVETGLLWIFAPLAALGMFVGSFQAAFQSDARRLLALSSVAQIGYMLLGLAFASAAGLAAGLLHLLNHALMKGALFMAVGAAATRLGAARVADFAGLGRVMPYTMACFAAAALSLVGVPLTAGFVSKWYLLTAAYERGWWWAIAAIVASSVLALVYVGRILEAAYMRPPPAEDGRTIGQVRAPLLALIPMMILAAACIGFGVDARFTAGLACRAAASLLPGDTGCLEMGGAP